MAIPDAVLRHTPLITEASYRTLQRMLQHPSAPRYNHTIGDGVTAEDRETYLTFRQRMTGPVRTHEPMVDFVGSLRGRSAWVDAHVPVGLHLGRDWHAVPTMRRHDVASRIEDLVPPDLPLDRMVAYDTSGTTGHAMVIPEHPGSIASRHAFADAILAELGVARRYTPDDIACINVCAQRHTFVMANTFSVWEGAGFAKINLHHADWAGGPQAARRFTGELAPHFLTGDPIAFAEAMAWDLPVSPAALLTTAVTLEPALRQRLESHFGCPVVDWYSLTETGPLAVTTHGRGYRLFAPDVYVEAVDADGVPVADGEPGELVVTGGRNPYLPLVRYRTGDRGVFGTVDGPDGPERGLVRIEGRHAVIFRDARGSPVNAVDLSRVMREHAVFVSHRLHQSADRTCALTLRPMPGVPIDTNQVRREVERLLEGTPVRVTIDETLGDDGKTVPFSSDAA